MNAKPKSMKVTMGVEAADGGFRVTVNGRPAMTPRNHPVVVPTRALAQAIADEIAAYPPILAGKGAADPAIAPNFRIAAGAIDLIDAEPDTRPAVERELAAYADTDLVCIRAEGPEGLTARENECWGPVCAWFAERFGAGLAITRGLVAGQQPEAVQDAIARAIAGRSSFELATLSLATRTAGSIVIGLALTEGAIDADTAFTAATLEETFQSERWGDDAEAAQARAVKRLDLAQAARFIELLSED